MTAIVDSNNKEVEYQFWIRIWRFELTTLVVIGTDCIGSCKSNYHMTMATTAPMNFKYDVQHISPNIKYMYFFHLLAVKVERLY